MSFYWDGHDPKEIDHLFSKRLGKNLWPKLGEDGSRKHEISCDGCTGKLNLTGFRYCCLGC
jgi:hypothetical protein